MLKSIVFFLVGMQLTGTVRAEEKDKEKTVRIEFRRAETEPGKDLTEAQVAGSTKKVYLHKTVEIEVIDVASAKLIEDSQMNPAIELVFTKEGAKKMASLSEKQMGKPIAILIDGKVVSAPIVRASISQKAQITGKMTKEEAEKIVRSIANR